MATNGDAVCRHITSSASCRSDAVASAAPTGTATITRRAPRALATRQAARAVDPVAIPSSTTSAVRPASGTGGGPARNWASRRSSLARSRASDAGDGVPGQPGLADHAIVDDRGTALADGAEAALRLERDAELAHHDHVERGPQLPGHLGRDRYAAARQGDHDGIGAPQVQQPARQLPSRVRTINEQHLATLPHGLRVRQRARPHRRARRAG